MIPDYFHTIPLRSFTANQFLYQSARADQVLLEEIQLINSNEFIDPLHLHLHIYISFPPSFSFDKFTIHYFLNLQSMGIFVCFSSSFFVLFDILIDPLSRLILFLLAIIFDTFWLIFPFLYSVVQSDCFA
jgi:hypothetical protein